MEKRQVAKEPKHIKVQRLCDGITGEPLPNPHFYTIEQSGVAICEEAVDLPIYYPPAKEDFYVHGRKAMHKCRMCGRVVVTCVRCHVSFSEWDGHRCPVR